MTLEVYKVSFELEYLNDGKYYISRITNDENKTEEGLEIKEAAAITIIE